MIMKGLALDYESEAKRLAPLFFPERLPSHLWLEIAAGFPSFELHPIPGGGILSAWDCKVTPAGCACQEGNTIGCIPSNDGLDAGLRPGFPQESSVLEFQVDRSGLRDRILDVPLFVLT